MITYIYSLFLGIGIAVISSLPVGPLTLSVVQAGLNQSRRSAFLMAFGGLTIELFFCAIALFGLNWIFGANEEETAKYMNYFYLFTIPVLLILGIFAIKNRHKEKFSDPNVKAHGPLLIGALMCLSNPVLFGYWVGVISTLRSMDYLGSSIPELLLFILGVGLGITMFFIIIIRLTTRSGKNLSPLTRARINVIFGVVFLAFAGYLIVRFLMEVL